MTPGGGRAYLALQYTEVAQDAELRLDELLSLAAEPSPAVDFDALQRTYEPRPLPPEAVAEPPRWADYAPDPGPVTAAAPGKPLLSGAYQQQLAAARLVHQRALREYRDHEKELRRRAEEARLSHEQDEQQRARSVREYNDRLRNYRAAYEQGEPAAVESVLERALAAAGRLPGLEVPARVSYRALTRTAVVDLVLPSPAVVPPALEFQVVEDGGVEPVPRPRQESLARYQQLIARLVLRALDAILAADTESQLDGIVLNGRAVTAEAGETCVVSVDARRGDLYARTLLPQAHHEAVERLRDLPSVLTDDPFAPAPVTPYAVACAAAPAPEELSPGEFAALVAELFEHLGLDEWELRLHGRDGLLALGHGDGRHLAEAPYVVCAARRPLVVSAEAVRNVAEVVEEEAAEQGIWATTGSFHPDAVIAAASLPELRLIDGGELRALIRAHLGTELGG
ncbi:restriction endonuclease [Streptacidiphilus sp. PB12-B1b]|uniref:restriction endonuclease n=1 Tax=Streptacidiphilus sp. PB12-B1b TaxID=2705012 RepID=UPI0015FB5EA7|nr:restriction endonuclease [Streptacidiphilus sp. PB12-B1b]QMU75447.1 restriction endonuclease [Streptacidiphilus sp. PB12-B1b]